MICRFCGSDNVNVSISTYQQERKRSFLFDLLMVFCTGGFWFLWIICRPKKGKMITKKFCTCQKCGGSWEMK